MSTAQISIRLPSTLIATLEKRGPSRAGAIESICYRYLALVAAGRGQLRELTDDEWSLCRDALNGTWMRDGHEQWVGLSVMDYAKGDGGAEKWGVDVDHLQAALDRLDMAGKIALVDEGEQWGRSNG